MPLLSEWLGHAQMETTIKYYANADIRMKQEAIEKATSDLILFSARKSILHLKMMKKHLRSFMV